MSLLDEHASATDERRPRIDAASVSPLAAGARIAHGCDRHVTHGRSIPRPTAIGSPARVQRSEPTGAALEEHPTVVGAGVIVLAGGRRVARVARARHRRVAGHVSLDGGAPSGTSAGQHLVRARHALHPRPAIGGARGLPLVVARAGIAGPVRGDVAEHAAPLDAAPPGSAARGGEEVPSLAGELRLLVRTGGLPLVARVTGLRLAARAGQRGEKRREQEAKRNVEPARDHGSSVSHAQTAHRPVMLIPNEVSCFPRARASTTTKDVPGGNVTSTLFAPCAVHASADFAPRT
jgi:hypothetical protein